MVLVFMMIYRPQGIIGRSKVDYDEAGKQFLEKHGWMTSHAGKKRERERG
jgi:hypothetical protein